MKNEFKGVKQGIGARTDLESCCELYRNSVTESNRLTCGKTTMNGGSTSTIALIAGGRQGLRESPTESDSSLRSA